jgi:hypothetical protein
VRVNWQMVPVANPKRFESLLHKVDETMLRETQDWPMLMRCVEIMAS